MTAAPVAESLVGVFVAMTLVVTFRRRTPRLIELAVWSGLILFSVVAIAGAGDPRARALTATAAWGAGQLVGIVADLLKQGALRWIYATRFLIADWVVLIVGVDVVLLALVATKRQAGAEAPVTRLREWMELPALPPARPKVAAASRVDELNLRINAWIEPAAAAAAMRATLFVIELRDVQIRRVVRGVTALALPATARHAVAPPQPLVPHIVPIDLLGTRAPTRRATRRAAGTSTRAPRTRATPVRSHKSVSEKHPESRLAS